jgi:ABC-type polysaccharide/polyol phosphate transport system ATPase subunit
VNAIEVRNVRKTYRRYGRQRHFSTLKSALLSGKPGQALQPQDSFDALKGVSFCVRSGHTVGVIGRNGSGKSTVLKLIAGIGRPTSGTIEVRGRVSALIELGAGFHPEISGRDNVFINGMMLGLSRREIEAKFAEIVAFAELEDFIDAPVKTYSSGMYMRLGFAVAIHVDPDVLLVDEVLAVGDESFTHKCLDKFAEFRRRGRTVLLVTHSLDLVTRFCDEALWLDGGLVRTHGDPRRVIDAYLLDVAETEGRALAAARQAVGAVPAGAAETSAEPADMTKALEGRWGSREVEIVTVDLLGAGGAPVQYVRSGDPLEIRLHARAREPVSDLVFGIGVFNAEGICCYGTNTHIEGAVSGEMQGEGEVRFTIERLDLVEGTYKLDVAAHRRNGTPYDYHRQLYTLRVASPQKDTGIFRPPHRWSFSGGIRFSGVGSPGDVGTSGRRA